MTTGRINHIELHTKVSMDAFNNGLQAGKKWSQDNSFSFGSGYKQGYEDGKSKATKEILVLIDKWEQEHYMELTEVNRYINKEDIEELKQQLQKLGEEE